MSIKLFNIKISPIDNSSTLFKLEQPVELVSPFMRVVFPIEENYGNLYLKLEFSNYRENEKMLKFFKLLYSLEQSYCTKLVRHINKKCNIKSQLSQYKDYDTFILIKIPKKKNYVNTTILNFEKRTFYDIKRNEFVKVSIYADILWTNTKDVVFKWKVKDLEFQNQDN